MTGITSVTALPEVTQDYQVWGCWGQNWYTLKPLEARTVREAERKARRTYPTAKVLHVVPLTEAA